MQCVLCYFYPNNHRSTSLCHKTAESNVVSWIVVEANSSLMRFIINPVGVMCSEGYSSVHMLLTTQFKSLDDVEQFNSPDLLTDRCTFSFKVDRIKIKLGKTVSVSLSTAPIIINTHLDQINS